MLNECPRCGRADGKHGLPDCTSDHQSHYLEVGYNKCYHLMVELQEDRDWWRAFALRVAALHLVWVAFFFYLVFGRS